MNDRRYEQGGVVSFVVVGVTLALLLTGAILWAKNQRGTTVQTPAPQTTQTTQKTGNETTNTVNLPGDGTSQQSPSSNTTPSPKTPATNPTPTPTVTTPAPAAPQKKVASTGPSVDQIPSTGPVEVFATAIALSVVSAAVYILAQSQKRVRASALK